MDTKKKIDELLSKDKYDFEDLCDVVRVLRSDIGCPWDREQDHKSIRNDLIEETYEVIEAIDNSDSVLLREELGDVLLQVVFHATIEEENGVFDIHGVSNDIVKKLIHRHPHVFGNVVADTSEKVLENWDKIKSEEKSRDTVYSSMESVPPMLPALMRARKLGARAAKVGFDFPTVEQAFSKIKEESAELEAVLDTDRAADELGDLLFSVANVARKLGVDPEEALQRSNKKFMSRFKTMEQLITDDGADIHKLDIETLDNYYDIAKKTEKY